MKLSCAIPCYEMFGQGVQFLERSLEVLENQTFRDFEIVVTDNSEDFSIKRLCQDFDVRYIRYGVRGMGANTNEAILNCKGELIKILYQDDYLTYPEALQDIVDNFKDEDNWLFTGSHNNPHPRYSNVNTLGSPSAMTIRNKNPLLFDETLKWALDLEYYKRMYKAFGEPKILDKVGVVIGLGEHQQTRNLDIETKMYEENLVATQR